MGASIYLDARFGQAQGKRLVDEGAAQKHPYEPGSTAAEP